MTQYTATLNVTGELAHLAALEVVAHDSAAMLHQLLDKARRDLDRQVLARVTTLSAITRPGYEYQLCFETDGVNQTAWESNPATMDHTITLWTNVTFWCERPAPDAVLEHCPCCRHPYLLPFGLLPRYDPSNTDAQFRIRACPPDLTIPMFIETEVVHECRHAAPGRAIGDNWIPFW